MRTHWNRTLKCWSSDNVFCWTSNLCCRQWRSCERTPPPHVQLQVDQLLHSPHHWATSSGWSSSVPSLLSWPRDTERDRETWKENKREQPETCRRKCDATKQTNPSHCGLYHHDEQLHFWGAALQATAQATRLRSASTEVFRNLLQFLQNSSLNHNGGHGKESGRL